MMQSSRRPRTRSIAAVWMFGILLCSGYGASGPAVATGEEGEEQQQDTPTLTTETSPQCWVFSHLQKCGGSTIKNIIRDRWGSRRAIYDTTQWLAGDQYTNAFGQRLLKGETWNVIAGGYTEALRNPVGDDCKFFTMFRHPVSRLVSAYFYCQKAPGDQLCASEVVHASDVDLVTFARHWGNFALRQFALNFVHADDVVAYVESTGAAGRTGEDVLEIPGWYLLKAYLDHQGGLSDGDELIPLETMLRSTQDLIRDRVAAVGILEHFDTTLDLFSAALEMPDLDWRAEFETQGIGNADGRYHKEEEAALEEAWTNSEIKSYINLDILLYEHAVDVFNSQVELYGLSK